MVLPIVESLSGLQESIFSPSRGPQLHFGEKSKIGRILSNLSIFPLFPCLGSLGLLSFFYMTSRSTAVGSLLGHLWPLVMHPEEIPKGIGGSWKAHAAVGSE